MTVRRVYHDHHDLVPRVTEQNLGGRFAQQQDGVNLPGVIEQGYIRMKIGVVIVLLPDLGHVTQQVGSMRLVA